MGGDITELNPSQSVTVPAGTMRLELTARSEGRLELVDGDGRTLALDGWRRERLGQVVVMEELSVLPCSARLIAPSTGFSPSLQVGLRCSIQGEDVPDILVRPLAVGRSAHLDLARFETISGALVVTAGTGAAVLRDGDAPTASLKRVGLAGKAAREAGRQLSQQRSEGRWSQAVLLIDGSASVRTLATDIVSVAVDLVDGVVEASTTGGLRQIGLIGADDVFKVEPGEAILLSARVVAALAERPAQLGAGVSRSTLERLSQSPELTLFASQDDGLGQTGRGLLVVITDDELPDRAQVDSWAKSSDWDWRVILVGEAAEQSAAPQTIRLTSFTADRPQKWAATFMDRPTVLRAAVAKLLESGPD